MVSSSHGKVGNGSMAHQAGSIGLKGGVDPSQDNFNRGYFGPVPEMLSTLLLVCPAFSKAPHSQVRVMLVMEVCS